MKGAPRSACEYVPSQSSFVCQLSSKHFPVDRQSQFSRALCALFVRIQRQEKMLTNLPPPIFIITIKLGLSHKREDGVSYIALHSDTRVQLFTWSSRYLLSLQK